MTPTRLACAAVAIWALGATSCSSSTESAAKKRAADKEVNTRHLKGTTAVLKNYRFGEAPKKVTEAKPK